MKNTCNALGLKQQTAPIRYKRYIEDLAEEKYNEVIQDADKAIFKYSPASIEHALIDTDLI